MGRRDVAETDYLLHFDPPYRHARHYLGWTEHLEQRLARHQAGGGARLMTVITDAQITWRLARTWEGTRAAERRLKNRAATPGSARSAETRCRHDS
jgi:hypothetical protein